MALLTSIVVALLRFVAGPVIAGALVWWAAGFWLLSLDRGDFAERHRAWLVTLNGQVDALHGRMTEVDKRKYAITEEIAAQENRAGQASKVIATLRESGWKK
jgi:hypothetical protein